MLSIYGIVLLLNQNKRETDNSVMVRWTTTTWWVLLLKYLAILKCHNISHHCDVRESTHCRQYVTFFREVYLTDYFEDQIRWLLLNPLCRCFRLLHLSDNITIIRYYLFQNKITFLILYKKVISMQLNIQYI